MTKFSSLLVLATLALSCASRVTRQASSNKIRRVPGLDVCGLSNAIGTKVTDGSPAELGEFPWMAVIGYVYTGFKDVSWGCGGSLITDRYVLTAAHCVHPSVISAKRRRTVYVIRLGELNLDSSVNDEAYPEDILVESVIPHEQYDNKRKTNDIALIKMARKVIFKDLLKPICLPPPEFDINNFEGFFPTVAGWGKTVADQPRNDTRLLRADIEIHNTEICRRNVTSVPSLSNAIIDARVVCASSPGKDSCQGDSGGPLMLPRRLKNALPNKSNYFLMGIVSYGYGCAREGYPGVYTRVSKFMTWIVSNMDI